MRRRKKKKKKSDGRAAENSGQGQVRPLNGRRSAGSVELYIIQHTARIYSVRAAATSCGSICSSSFLFFSLLPLIFLKIK